MGLGSQFMLVQRMEKEGRKTEEAEETGQMAVLSCIFRRLGSLKIIPDVTVFIIRSKIGREKERQHK